MKRTSSNEFGQTLLEIVIALGVVAVVISALVSATMSSLRYGNASRLRSRGVKLAQEALELTRKLRDVNPWSSFVGYSGSGTKDWCLNETGAWSERGGGDCPMAVGSTYVRTVTFTWNTSDPSNERMEVTVEVSWGARDSSSTVQTTTYFTRWK